jgi:CubicO group peptidase (beta-lactamase class C family)
MLCRAAAISGIASALLAFPLPCQTGSPAAAAFRAEVDGVVREVLATTGAPSASLSIVADGRIAYVQAYGQARLDPPTPARADMRYSVGSISKQFTATAVLMLAQNRKLSLDDPVSRFLPGLTRGRDVTIRQLLSHTSGYRDYWPQDYVPPFMIHPIDAEAILDRWARKPLDFEPGTQYQYSNTGYVIAGRIVEKAAGMPLLPFLQARVFAPLSMASVLDVDQGRLTESDATGYMRYALGPLRPAPKEGKGWLFAAGELAMTAEDLARWNVGMIERRLLDAASYDAMQTAVRLKNGVGAGYGLGLDVTTQDGHRVLAHGGEVSGFSASNVVFPDDRAAISVLTNLDATGASSAIAKRVAPLLFEKRDAAAASEARARRVFEDLQRGHVDRALLTDNASAYFTEQAVGDFAASLAPLGAPAEFKQVRQRERGGMTLRVFSVKFAKRSLEIWERDLPDGKIEQDQVMAAD